MLSRPYRLYLTGLGANLQTKSPHAYIQISVRYIWEGEPPGEPLLENSGEDVVFSVNNHKHNNAAHQEVRPPIFGFGG